MKTIARIFIGLFVFGCIIVSSCKRDSATEVKESILKGTATVIVDETVQPMLEDQAAVFESQYPGRIKLVNKPEAEAINELISDNSRIIILSRKLTEEEETYYRKRKIIPAITPIAVDGIALIVNKTAKDTVIDLQEVIDFIQGKTSKIKKLVFDNPNSSTLRYVKGIAGVDKEANSNVTALKSNNEVIEYIAGHDDAIGVVGVNWITQPSTQMKKHTDKITVLSVKNVKNKKGSEGYYKPSQSNLSEGLYPLSRELYLLNYQGIDGLGMGFASFVAGDIGQRIILKSGLLPVRIPPRQIILRNNI
ncbi:PstS family phosphate ABC transporter substrate-binding protein [Flavobacterium kingsejongi]|uniref:PBP domain-containing protein n=1 Tax=Flavobacterium kingsejongi TaxID=1678728 RepID=A0A2S1LNI0_9FLAO|nr:substrate-binding domain-containing protein [Flavobacterium kingsejongi]AWG25186.1 hypothetical protein FK004_08030 [Flavobacterium kingsejongi]